MVEARSTDDRHGQKVNWYIGRIQAHSSGDERIKRCADGPNGHKVDQVAVRNTRARACPRDVLEQNICSAYAFKRKRSANRAARSSDPTVPHWVFLPNLGARTFPELLQELLARSGGTSQAFPGTA